MNQIQTKLSLSHKLSLLNNLENYFRNHTILTCPFLKNLENGKLCREQIKLWISQQFYFSTHFPRCIAALYSRIEDFTISKPLINFLNIEHWGSNNNTAHWKMFKMVLDFFELDIEKLKVKDPTIETKIYLDYRLNLCLNAPVEESLGALGFGHEFINEKIFASYLKGMSQIENIPENVLLYFKAHVEDEPEDYRIFKDIIVSYCNSIQSLEMVKKGAEDVIQMRINFFEGILKRIRNSAKTIMVSP